MQSELNIDGSKASANLLEFRSIDPDLVEIATALRLSIINKVGMTRRDIGNILRELAQKDRKFKQLLEYHATELVTAAFNEIRE